MAKHESQRRGNTGSSSLFGMGSGWSGGNFPVGRWGVDYAALRAAAPMAEVLELIGWKSVARKGAQLRGPCPIHRSSSDKSRIFSVNLDTNAFQCFSCGGKGSQLDLWVALTKLPLYEAALDLARRLGIEPERIRKQDR